jgi:hypothetical protein
MVVRVQAHVEYVMTYQDAGSITLDIVSSVNGVIGSDTASESLAGFHLIPGDTLAVDIRDYAAVAGEVFSIALSRSGVVAGGFKSVGTDETCLRVGRVTQVWDDGNVFWEAP